MASVLPNLLARRMGVRLRLSTNPQMERLDFAGRRFRHPARNQLACVSVQSRSLRILGMDQTNSSERDYRSDMKPLSYFFLALHAAVFLVGIYVAVHFILKYW